MSPSRAVLLLAVTLICVPEAAAQGMGGGAKPGASGAATYQKLCVSCHGQDGKGNAEKAKAFSIDAALLDLTRPAAMKLSRDELKTVTLKGRNKMPGYEKKLKPDQVEPLVDHMIELRSRAKAK